MSVRSLCLHHAQTAFSRPTKTSPEHPSEVSCIQGRGMPVSSGRCTACSTHAGASIPSRTIPLGRGYRRTHSKRKSAYLLAEFRLETKAWFSLSVTKPNQETRFVKRALPVSIERVAVPVLVLGPCDIVDDDFPLRPAPPGVHFLVARFHGVFAVFAHRFCGKHLQLSVGSHGPQVFYSKRVMPV